MLIMSNAFCAATWVSLMKMTGCCCYQPSPFSCVLHCLSGVLIMYTLWRTLVSFSASLSSPLSRPLAVLSPMPCWPSKANKGEESVSQKEQQQQQQQKDEIKWNAKKSALRSEEVHFLLPPRHASRRSFEWVLEWKQNSNFENDEDTHENQMKIEDFVDFKDRQKQYFETNETKVLFFLFLFFIIIVLLLLLFCGSFNA